MKSRTAHTHLKGSQHASIEYQYAREGLHGDRSKRRDREGHRNGIGQDGGDRSDGLP